MLIAPGSDGNTASPIKKWRLLGEPAVRDVLDSNMWKKFCVAFVWAVTIVRLSCCQNDTTQPTTAQGVFFQATDIVAYRTTMLTSYCSVQAEKSQGGGATAIDCWYCDAWTHKLLIIVVWNQSKTNV